MKPFLLSTIAAFAGSHPAAGNINPAPSCRSTSPSPRRSTRWTPATRKPRRAFAIERTNIGGEEPLAPGKHVVRCEVIPDSATPGTGGKSILSVDGKQVAEARIPNTQPFAFSADDGADVGLDADTNVSPDYPQFNNAFTGKIVKVTVEQK